MKPADPNKRYGAIYADPAWIFATRSPKGKGRSAERHYDCMSLPEIEAIPVADWAAPDCALFLWTIDPMLPQAMRVMNAWGFEFRTVAFYWAKTNKRNPDFFMGPGYWTRANPEQCWLGVRGHPKRRSRSVRRLIVSPRREHSRKPDETRTRIEQLVGGPYLELFARSRAPGWDGLGNEVEKFAEAA
jgi:N6-adenosine-specific RNA methylase IME4